MEKILKQTSVIILYVTVVFLLFHFSRNLEIFKTDGIDSWINSVEISIKKSPFSIEGMTYPAFKIFIAASFISVGMLSIYFMNNKKYRKGKEYGSAEWATKKDSMKLADYSDKKNNIILTQTEKLTLNTRQSGKNLNVLVIGGSGSGKTRYFVEPNLMQLNTSYVVTDPKGELLRNTYEMMKKNGYIVKVLNLVEMKYGNTYNPFNYIRNENDVLVMIDTLIKNTTPEGQRAQDPFWEKSEIALLQAICFYLYYETDSSAQNFEMVMHLIRKAEIKEDNENYKSALDLLFEELEKKEPLHIAVKQYKIFKQAAGKTAKSILISVSVRLSAFNIRDVIDLTSTDTLDLGSIGDRKTILYIIISDAVSTYNFIAAMLYSQLFSVLYYKADFVYKGSMPVHVRFILDEFANIGIIPEFDEKIATARSREISISIILQGLTQLKGIYKERWENITSNCDNFLYLGGQEQSTMDYIMKYLGKQTIYQKGTSLTRGRNRSSSLNESLLGRELLTIDEIRKLDRNKCILIITGIKPFLSKKYDIKRHPRYKELDDEDGYDLMNLKRFPKVDIKKKNKKIKNEDNENDSESVEIKTYDKGSETQKESEVIKFSDIDLNER